MRDFADGSGRRRRSRRDHEMELDFERSPQHMWADDDADAVDDDFDPDDYDDDEDDYEFDDDFAEDDDEDDD